MFDGAACTAYPSAVAFAEGRPPAAFCRENEKGVQMKTVDSFSVFDQLSDTMAAQDVADGPEAHDVSLGASSCGQQHMLHDCVQVEMKKDRRRRYEGTASSKPAPWTYASTPPWKRSTASLSKGWDSENGIL